MPSNASFQESLRGYTYTFDPGVAAMPTEPIDPSFIADRTYTVVSAVSLSSLMRLVNERLDDKKWVTSGGIAFANGAFHQALSSETKLTNV